jgi:outer membrane protein OmpA-like peptidoglycan-associated protein
MKQFCITLLTLSNFFLSSQNLVLNPSFEEHSSYKCIVNLGGFNHSVIDWSTPNKGTTDLFDSCSEDMGIKNYNGFQKPKTGTSYAGMYLYTDKNYREYVQGQLSEILEKGKQYRMKFYLSLADKSSYGLKDIQVLITEKQLKACYASNSCEKTIIPSKATEGNFKLYANTDPIYFSDKESWMAYSFEFTAEGYETYFSIGNFERNPKTKKQKVLSDSPYFFSYYYIDDVSIEPIQEDVLVEEDEIPEEPLIKTNEVYTFKNVLFEFDKAELLKVSKAELDQLLNHLNSNLNLSIEIYGHTDHMGLDTRNKELSQQRAKAVADYLISQGLNRSRIQSFGFGSSKPVADNTTEEGRQLNRRVEFKLIDN